MTNPLELKQAFIAADEAHCEALWSNAGRLFGKRKKERRVAKLLKNLNDAGDAYAQHVFAMIAEAGLNPFRIVGPLDLRDEISEVEIFIGRELHTIAIVETLGGLELMLPDEVLDEDGLVKEEFRENTESAKATK